jgi:hypothetical protein
MLYDILALPATCKRQVPKIAVKEMLKYSANNKHVLGGHHVTLEPENKIRYIRNVNWLSKVSKTSSIGTYTQSFISNSCLISSLVAGGNLRRYCPRHLPTP